MSFEREAFEEALGAEGALEAFARDPFVLVEAAGGAFDLGPDWEMRAVDSLRDSDDPMFHPEGCDVPAELDEHAFDERRARILHAGRVKDLGIYEDGARKAMADEVLDAFERGGEQAALDALKDVHDRTENLYLRDACDTILGRVRAKTIDFGAKAQVVDALSDIYGLQAGMRAAQRTVQGNPLLACEQLDAMVGACDGSGLFADSATKKYRYFDSYASRALYAVRCPEAADGRELRLCADEYFLCHYRLASVLASSIERAEEAIAHARRCVELAPTVAASHLRLARCYFSVFDYRSEIEALRRMLDVVWNPADLGLALYWLGYAFFMVDDPAAGLACYQTCPVFDPSLSEPASAELADLLRKREMEPRPLPREECEAVFADRGIDLDGLKRNADALMLVAGAAVDAGSYGLARNLLASAQAVLRDDAAPAVIASLEP